MSEQSTSGDPMAFFGPNEWLVDELYQQYLTDKDSVDRAWWAFFDDYTPLDAEAASAATVNGGPAARPAKDTATEPTATPAPGATSTPAATPAAKDSDADTVDALLSSLTSVRADSFVDTPPAKATEEAVVTREVDGGLQTVALRLPAIVTTDLPRRAGPTVSAREDHRPFPARSPQSHPGWRPTS